MAKKQESFSLLSQKIPGYRLNNKLGQGGMGTVYHATQLSLDRPVAIKVMTRRLSKNPMMIQRFEREAGALAKLNHPNLVSIIERGSAEGVYFFVMELIEGPSLRDVIATTPLSRDEFGKFITQVGAALSHMHQAGIIHRDIKPSNILRDPQGNFRLSDFGLVHILRDEGASSRSGTASGSLVGTPMYLAPEQLHARGTISPATDVYGLGVVVYELLTGVLPLGRFKLPNEMNASVSESLSDAVKAALARDPNERFQTIEDFIEALNRGIDESPNLRLRISKIAFEQRESGSGAIGSDISASGSRAIRARQKRTHMYIGLGIMLVVAAALLVISLPRGGGNDDSGGSTSGGGGSASVTPVNNPVSSLTWVSSQTDLFSQAQSNGRVPIVVVTADGTTAGLEATLSPDAVRSINQSAVFLAVDPLQGSSIAAIGRRPDVLEIFAFDRQGSTVLRQGKFPPVEGLANFAATAAADAERWSMWKSNIDDAFFQARTQRKVVVLLVSLGRLTNEQLNFYKLEIMSSPAISSVASRVVFVALQEPAMEDRMLQEFGFFSFPLLAVMRYSPGSQDFEIEGREIIFPISNYTELERYVQDALRAVGN